MLFYFVGIVPIDQAPLSMFNIHIRAVARCQPESVCIVVESVGDVLYGEVVVF